MRPILFLALALGCNKASEDTGSSRECSVNFELEFPSGSEADITDCFTHTMDATFEFDPDDGPEPRNLSVYFSATTESQYECSMRLEAGSLCGPGTYNIGTGSETSLDVSAFDCVGVPD